MKELVCIVCPKGCHLKIDENNGYSVSGNACARGEVYGKKELQNPTRTLTSTVRITGAALSRLPVKTDREIPKADLPRLVHLLDSVAATAPVQMGDVLVTDIGGTGANLVATRTLPAATPGHTCVPGML